MIEIMRGKSKYVYRISDTDPTVIMVRPNRHNARWKTYGTFSSADSARDALLSLERGDDEGQATR